ncbi:MAG: TonB-dependent receptor [Bacteroidota bacterium]
MKFKLFVFIISFAFGSNGFGQSVNGVVVDQELEPLIGATILELGTRNGSVTDINGRFQLTLRTKINKLVISFTGFKTDTIAANLTEPMRITLSENVSELGEVVVTSSPTFMDQLESKHVEIITEAELNKAACCNLSESFETNASVDVSYTDAVSGAKTIRMLGLDGRYVQINRENTPHIRGLIGRYGLGYIPGTWIQSIDVGKGSGSIVNGYESMTGQLNVELKKPETSEALYLNGYVNSFGRMEANANHARDLSDKWSTAFLFHGDYFSNEIDNNNDGFLDLPKSRQFNLMNRYKFMGDRLRNQIGIQVMRDEKAGGQLGYGFGDDFQNSTPYGFMNNTTRVEVFGKTGLLFPQKPYKGWGFIYSGSYTDINAGFGRNEYLGTEKTGYVNAIYQNILSNSFHQYKAGASFLIDDFEEVYADSAFSRQEVVPGVYYEYSYLPGEKFSLILGGRIDFHNLYGNLYSPRLHTRYQLSDKTSLRLAAGRGYRVANPIIESSNILVSSRQLVVQEAPEPEISWNLGGSLVTNLKLGHEDLNLVFDYFYTNFENQLIYDMDQSSDNLFIYNLNGDSYAHSFQVEAKYALNQFLEVKAAYKFYDVRTTIAGRLQEVSFVSRDRFFLNASYATKYDKWKADITVHWYGQKRLPDTGDKPVELQRQAESPDYFHINAQVSRGYRWGSIYLGSENLLGFTQDDPIIDANNPFGEDFDASIVWGPIVGRMVYAGVRYKIKRANN